MGRGRWFIEFLGGGGVVKKRESPDFRSPEVGISVFSSLRIDQVNKYLDQVAQSNVEHKREDVKKVLQLLLRNTSALEQVLI